MKNINLLIDYIRKPAVFLSLAGCIGLTFLFCWHQTTLDFDQTIILFNCLLFIIAMVLSFVTTVKILTKKDEKNKKLQPQPETIKIDNKKYNIILISIVLLGIFVRIWDFGSVPAGVNQDGAMAAVDGKALADYGTDRYGNWLPAHLYAWGIGQMSSLLSYLIAIFVKFFGLNIITMRLPQLIVSILGGLFFYIFMKDNFGKNVGLLALFFVAINPWHFVQSRWAVDCNLLPHLFMGGMCFFSKGLLTQKRRYTYISMVFFAFCMYCYGITIYSIPPLLACLSIYYCVKKQIRIRDIFISAFIFLAISWPFILTMAFNYLKIPTMKLPFVTIQYFPNSVRSKDLLFFSNNFFKQLWENICSLFKTVVAQNKDAPWNAIPGFGIMYYFTLPFAFVGIIGLIKTKIKGNKSLVVFSALIGVFVGICTNNVNINRINIIYYGIMMFVVFGTYCVIREIKKAWTVSFAIYLMSFVLMVAIYFTSYANLISYYFYYGFEDALIAAEETGADTIYIARNMKLGIRSDKNITDNKGTNEILTLFYDKTDAKYFQGETNINNGKECLPYKQRFVHETIDEDFVNDLNEQNSAAFIVKEEELACFEDSKYNINQYGYYYMVYKK